MAAGVGGRILIRRLGRCEMGKWDKLSRRGVRGNRAFKLLFGEFVFFFFFSFICYSCESVKKGLVRGKTGPSAELGGVFFTGLLAAHMSEVFCHMAVGAISSGN